MTKKAQKVIKIYNEMVADGMIRRTWTHEDYDDVAVYADANGDVICLQRNEKGEIVDAWIE